MYKWLTLGSLLSIFFAGIVSWRPIIINMSLSYPLTHIQTWLGIESPESVYNQALTLAQVKKYPEAIALLERLAHAPPPSIDQYVYELYGDLLYLSSGSIDDVKKLYRLAESLESLPRLEQKIALLDADVSGSGGGNILPPDHSGSIMRESRRTGTDALLLQSTLDTLTQSEAEKSKYLYPINGLPRSESEQLSDIRSFVDDGVERVDW